MTIREYCEYNAGQKQAFVPREADTVELKEAPSAGIEVREYASLADYLREINGVDSKGSKQ
jgi:hypothetical protein